MWRWIIGLVLLSHGVGHVLFMPLLADVLRLPATGQSWLLTGALGPVLTRLLATVGAAAALVLFAAAAFGLFGAAPWWRTAAVAGAAVSLVLVVVMWNGLPVTNTFFALVVDVAVLVALLVLHRPAPEQTGA